MIPNIEQLRKTKSEIIVLEKGKVPPQAIDLEEAVLGGLMIDSSNQDEVFAVIKTPEVFYNQKHQFIFQAMLNLHNNHSGYSFEEREKFKKERQKKSTYDLGLNPIDLLTVSNELKKINALEKVGGDYYLISLTQNISSSAHIEVHCHLLLQFYVKRLAIKHASEVIDLAYDDATDVFDLISKNSINADSLNDVVNIGNSSKTIGQALDEVEEKVKLLTNKSSEEITGCYTGFARLNELTNGWQPSDLVIIAARPGMGKTSFVIKTALSNLKKNIPVGFISLEMSVVQLTTRIVAVDTHFHLNQLFRNGFEHAHYFVQLDEAKRRIKQYPIHFADNKTELNDVVTQCRSWVKNKGVKLLIIDYLQLISNAAKGHNREQEIASITRRLKLLAKELSVPIILLSQLSRAVETRGSSKRPMLSDLRESGAAEQDADLVAFLYRPEYYQLEVDEDIVSLGGNSEFIIAKHRNGSLDTVAMYWDGSKTKYWCIREKNQGDSTYGLPNINPNEAF